MKPVKKVFAQTELHALMFFLCLALFNWPFVSIFGQCSSEALSVYLFAVWLISIAVLFLIATSCRRESKTDGGTERATDD